MNAAALPVAGTVTAIGSGWYRVTTDSGRVLRVTSATPWTMGARVLVLGSVIIGSAGAAPSTTVYEV